MLTGLLLPLAAAMSWPTSFATQPPQGAPATCAHQSTARFPAAREDLVVGPLVLAGGRTKPTPQEVARFGGMKYPALVRVGHRVTIEVPRSQRGEASLLYSDGSHTGDERTVAAGDRAVAFRACPGRGPRASTYDGRAVTFWSGFVLTGTPRCLSLRIWVDDERRPRTARLALGRRCP